MERAAERDLLPMARALDLAVTPWGVLGAGVLTGKYNRKEATQGRAANWKEIPPYQLQVAETVMNVANEIGCSPAQVALSWVRQQPGVIIPLLGAAKVTQLQENLDSLKITLDTAQLAKLDAVSRIELGFPHDFLDSDDVRDVLFGGTFGKIDNHHRR